MSNFQAVIWAGLAVSSVFVVLRLYLRWHGPRRLFWEDAFLLFAYVLSPITAALWQWAAKDMYYTLNVEAGLAAYETDFLERLRRWLIVNLVVELFFYSSLLSVKLSFLFFFKRLGSKVQGQKYVWWPVLGFSITAFLVSLGDVQYECLVGDMTYIVTYCGTSPAGRFTTITLQVNCVLDVLSDFLSKDSISSLLPSFKIHSLIQHRFSHIDPHHNAVERAHPESQEACLHGTVFTFHYYHWHGHSPSGRPDRDATADR